jgi:hypothetical protein
MAGLSSGALPFGKREATIDETGEGEAAFALQNSRHDTS